MGTLRIVSSGLMSSVQDLGRPGLGRVGVTAGGAADPLSLRFGNRLIGNADDAAAIEMTLTGCAVAFDEAALVSIAALGISAKLTTREGTPRSVERWRPIEVREGDTLNLGPMTRGVRGYLCIAGGIEAERLLGGRGTHFAGAFGGHEGRALRAGDRLSVGRATGSPARDDESDAARALVEEALGRRTLRALEGPAAHGFSDAVRRAFWAGSFTVSSRSDRMGVRLRGSTIQAPGGGRMASEGMAWGAVQAPPSGEPIILGVDHPTTGGYPVIACVAAVDLPALGQLRSEDGVSFERVSLEEAHRLLREREMRLDETLPCR